MASEAVASPMRIATAPGRLARPAPPGNDDPCEERRTIPEGMPRLPREAWTQVADGRLRCQPKRKQRPAEDNGEHGPGSEIPRGAPQGERARRRATQDVSPQTACRACPICGKSKSGWLARRAAYRSRPWASCGA